MGNEKSRLREGGVEGELPPGAATGGASPAPTAAKRTGPKRVTAAGGTGAEGKSGPEDEGGGSPGADDDDEAVDVAIERHLREAKGGVRRDISVEDFDLLKVLGRGSYGKVMLVRFKGDGQLYALKTLRKSTLLRRNQVAHTKTERAVLQAVDHPFIVRLRFAFQTRDKLYLVTDYAPGGELFFWLKRERVFSQARVRLYAAELILALEYLHEKDIVYRDLKPENILLDAEGHIKITDFGLSKGGVSGFGAEGGTNTFCGTPEYLAPEILDERRWHGKAVDWWSLGTLLYEMCAGLPPFYDENVETMYEKIMTDELVFPRHFLPQTKDLLSKMLERDVTKRLGYGGASELKVHPFFEGLDWDEVLARRVKPSFAPPAPASDGDVPHFEAEFTRQAPVDSVPDSKAMLSATAAERTHFDGFTYVGSEGDPMRAAAVGSPTPARPAAPALSPEAGPPVPE